jgi:hypothetical protein
MPLADGMLALRADGPHFLFPRFQVHAELFPANYFERPNRPAPHLNTTTPTDLPQKFVVCQKKKLGIGRVGRMGESSDSSGRCETSEAAEPGL